MEEKKNNKGLIWLIVILTVLVLGLAGYIVYDKVLLKDKTILNNNITNTTTTTNKQNHDTVSLEEKKQILEILNFNDTINLINHQNDDVKDIKSFIETNNDEVLKTVLIRLSNDGIEQKELTIANIDLKAKELYGYDLDLKYNDIYDGDAIAYKYDSSTKKYTMPYGTAFAYGVNGISFFNNIIDITKDNNNYEVNFNIVWTSEAGAGDKYDLYSNYEDAKNQKNPILITNEDDERYFLSHSHDEIAEYLFVDKGLNKKTSIYKAKISLGSNVKIINFEKQH